MLQLRKTLELARDTLSKERIDFALIGGFALGAHGIHRATSDIDLLVDGQHKVEVKDLFQKIGFKLYHETIEVMQFTGPGNLDVVFANRPLSLGMINEAKRGVKLAGVPVVSREALIGLKIQAYKNDSKRELQDKADIQSLLRQPGVLMSEVKKYADLFSAWDEIEGLLK